MHVYLPFSYQCFLISLPNFCHDNEEKVCKKTYWALFNRNPTQQLVGIFCHQDEYISSVVSTSKIFLIKIVKRSQLSTFVNFLSPSLNKWPIISNKTFIDVSYLQQIYIYIYMYIYILYIHRYTYVHMCRPTYKLHETSRIYHLPNHKLDQIFLHKYHFYIDR